MVDPLALRLANTIRATSRGLTDAFGTPESTRDWLIANAENLGDYLDLEGYLPSEADRTALVELRRNVRALFAEYVAPQPPSSADAAVLPAFPDALAAINRAAAPALRLLDWDATGPHPEHRLLTASDVDTVMAGLSDATIAFFTSPEAAQIRTCPAPRCVRYFLKSHPRQEWCSVACGNRARAARHYAQHRD
ncbi:CGNR zinc finger domain-containing protein [Nocardia sp. CDC153]|uniref:CGNR zinc finger domain-containing protein n=1 Tax=Nocardia sp. CDC153 TaxID=3112167 RepID=UPI002DBE66DF|nr:CGNR zinc finger domain-containing protein [Nocardia sp. CDC153]MEC3954600.1 CGNR zinc finger domain-containing protein [Nocardia sp. CDC153]